MLWICLRTHCIVDCRTVDQDRIVDCTGTAVDQMDWDCRIDLGSIQSPDNCLEVDRIALVALVRMSPVVALVVPVDHQIAPVVVPAGRIDPAALVALLDLVVQMNLVVRAVPVALADRMSLVVLNHRFLILLSIIF